MSLDIWLIKEKCESDELAFWEGNITHNVNKIAMAVGSYECLWRPEEIGVVYAKDNIENLRRAIGMMYLNYNALEKLNPENGWGSLDVLIEFTKSYLEACVEFPDAIIEVSR